MTNPDVPSSGTYPLAPDTPPPRPNLFPGISPKPAIPQTSHPASQPAPPATWWTRFPSPPVFWGLFALITGVAFFLRFWRLDHQSYWTDEAYTVPRIAQSFAFLLDELSGRRSELGGAPQGFPPGWYALLRWWRIILDWWTGNPTDSYHLGNLRILPAFIGLLTVPALYYLARQFTDRKGALLVMLLAAVNPFLIYYSRDVKMYAAFWFFVTLNMALFLHWQSSRRQTLLFSLYVLSGVGMMLMHGMGVVLLVLQLIFILTRPRPRPADAPLFILGAGLISWIAVYWYFVYLEPNRLAGRMASDIDNGMYWIQMYTDMSWKTVGGLPTSHLLGYLWPEYPPSERINDWFLLGYDFDDHLATRSSPAMATGQLYAAWGLLAILLLGLIPWRRLREKDRLAKPVSAEQLLSPTRRHWWWIALWIAVPTIALALTWIPPESPWYPTIWDPIQRLTGRYPKPLWEPRYLGFIVPAWLLWLAASMRRLPTWPLRTAVITGVVAACTWSSFSNHLIYRHPPFQRIADVWKQYTPEDELFSTAIATSAVKYPEPAENIAVTLARDVIPGTPEDLRYVPTRIRRGFIADPRMYWPQEYETPDDLLSWIQMISWSTQTSSRIQTVILVDKYADLSGEEDILSNEALNRILGERWKPTHEETFTWHYEWRFYIHHHWRIRVWTRN